MFSPRETTPRPDQTPVMSGKVQYVFRRLRAWRRAYSEGMILKGWRDLQFSRRIEAKGAACMRAKINLITSSLGNHWP